MSRTTLILVLLFAFLSSRSSLGQIAKEKTPETVPETQVSAETQATGRGAVIFYPQDTQRPPEGRYKVQTGQEIPICLKIQDADSSFLKRLKEQAIGFRLLMEDSQVPPRKMTVAVGNRLQKIVPDNQGCFSGTFTVPANTQSSLYQVADLLVADQDQSYYSVREFLYEFTQADELEVVNPQEDVQAPTLSAITTYHSNIRPIKVFSNFIKLNVEQIFIFEDPVSGIDKKSLRVYYELFVDGQSIALPKAKCKARRPEGRFVCRVRVGDTKTEWGLRDIVLTLHSIHIKDLAGNERVFQDPALFVEKAQGTPVKFEFVRKQGWPVQEKYELSRDQLY